MSDIVSFSPVRALDRDGVPVSGALAYFYQSGTTTPQIVYSDEAGTVPHAVPLEADSRGVFPAVYSSVALRCTVTDASGTALPGFPIDPVSRIPTGSGASEVTFAPTGDIPETNVQAAIERVQANLVAPLLAGGIGVTGNADVLANIDATNIASGAYRFDNTTTGTFPSGVTAAGGGTVRLWRETAAEAVMELSPRGSNVTWVRSMTASAWGAWVRMPVTLETLGVTSTAAELNLLDGLTRSLSGNGYCFLPGGLLVQWGATGAIGSGGTTASFPIPFPNNVFRIVLTPNSTVQTTATFQSLTTSSVFIQNWTGSASVHYIALGN